MTPIRVMIADDDEDVRDAMISRLRVDDDISIVGTGADADHAIAVAARERPDVAVLDVRMPGGGGVRAAREITRVSPGTELIAISAYDDPHDVFSMLRAGACGFLVKGDGTEQIVEAIRRCTPAAETPSRLPALLPSALGTRSFGSRETRSRIEALLHGDGIEVVYQPIFDLADGRPVAAEALCRFAVAPLRTPDLWFAEAAEVGLGIELEIASVRRAFARLRDLDPSIVLNVNVSPSTCRSRELRELLRQVPAERVALEITEGAPVDDYEGLDAALAPLRSLGVGLTIGDTCSGSASLRHVLHLRPDTIKLDTSLTRRIERDTVRRSLVEAIVGFAPSVGAVVLASGIESPRQLDALRDAGVRLGQGYHLGRPGVLPHSGTWPAWGARATDDARSREGWRGAKARAHDHDGRARRSQPTTLTPSAAPIM
jgi:EAL domain-containing protein (putative c-di-GMP-specific phosphodiesterase class I)/CheY-like chemotaxis protein